VPSAQIERVFENKRQRVAEGGLTELTHVVLRELDKPSPEALARALRVHAPFHALRRGDEPEVTRQPDGTWDLRWRLTHHGLLRLYVEETHLGACKAFAEGAEKPGGTWEAIGGIQVARPGSPASYRVFDASEPIVVRIEGEADVDGAIGVATRKLLVEPPPPGHVEERVLTPEVVAPILGQVVVGEGPTPPSLGGQVRLSELRDDGSRLPLALIDVPKDGRFLARRTGAGRYELVFDLFFFPGTTTLTVVGGGSFELTPSRPAAWARLETGALEMASRQVDVRVAPAERPDDLQPAAMLAGEQESAVALPGPGRWLVTIDLEGTNTLPPLRATASAELTTGEPPLLVPTAAPVPHGTLIVTAGKNAFGHARGAVVRVDRRTATLIPGLSETARFENVAAGPHRASIEWDEHGRARDERDVVVTAGETSTWVVEVDPR